MIRGKSGAARLTWPSSLELAGLTRDAKSRETRKLFRYKIFNCKEKYVNKKYFKPGRDGKKSVLQDLNNISSHQTVHKGTL